ncbi:MAG: type 4a pilus biogenesis protein PilO [Chloroflexi bacterium]|nr:type 4a pilus biogenesis protein PilO [Chloroflexota bacterium]
MTDFDFDNEGAGSSIISRIVTLLPVLLVGALLMGNILFGVTSIVPQWQLHEKLNGQLATAEAIVTQNAQQQAEDDTLAVLQAQVERAQTSVAQAAEVFPQPEQVDSFLNRLYDHARAAGAEISNLQAQQPAQQVINGAYDARLFRLQVLGTVPQLMNFIVRASEASLPTVNISNLSLKQDVENIILVMDVSIHTSEHASGEAFANLPTPIVMTPAIVMGATPVPGATPLPPTPTPVGSTVDLGVEPPLNLIYSDTFDTGDLTAWKLGTGWQLVTVEDGKALEISNGVEPVVFAQTNLLDSAAQARFFLQGGSARLSIRQSVEGAYTAVLDSSGQVALYRSGVLVESANTAPSSINRWRTMRLSAVQGIVRVTVDEVERIAVQDDAKLPPGTVSFALIGIGSLRVDDVRIWTLDPP